MYLLVTDNSYVSQAKHHHVHRARMATRNWLFPHIRSTHAQNVAVSALYFNDVILVVFHDYCLYLSLRVNIALCSDFYADFIYANFCSCVLYLFIYIELSYTEISPILGISLSELYMELLLKITPSTKTSASYFNRVVWIIFTL